MAPRAKSTAEASEPTRRSTRISSQPKSEPATEVKKAAPRAKKRTADEGGDETPAVKKAAAEAPDTEESNENESATPEAAKLATIDVGDVLPSLTLKNEKGEDVDVATLAADKGVIFFLVPKADTPGCTTQACGFRDVYPDFTAHNFAVYCLSADSPSAQTKWQDKKELPYPLLSDPQRVLITALGAGEGGKTKRSHFVFEKGGKLVEKKIPVKPADSPKLALEYVKSVAAAA
ncbi:AhpC-TSA-domain-containing protein [Fomitopsis serialis]|uniref:AhpC-TSA-domain-containing protein n=1 Tax=Fomitopsis serialis TaxID=139415 RepID=UPI002008B38F|nr:AhpC-TSA-domain-containing protein [Neoantrodia serialis]KAH9923512.1 AhpC-TSA-domain-containing protein [Neoantrodia serialis]